MGNCSARGGVLRPSTGPAAGVAATLTSLRCAPGPAQELVLALLDTLVLQQPRDAGLVAAVLQHAGWLLRCAADGAVPPALLSASWLQAVGACLAACVNALQEQGVLDLHADALIEALTAALAAPHLQQQSALWTRLLHDVVAASPLHAGSAAARLPLATPAAAGAAHAADLAGVWQLVAGWTASAGVRGGWRSGAAGAPRLLVRRQLRG